MTFQFTNYSKLNLTYLKVFNSTQAFSNQVGPAAILQTIYKHSLHVHIYMETME